MEQKILKKKESKEEEYLKRIKDPRIKEVFLVLISNNFLNYKKVNWSGDADESIKQATSETMHDKLQELNEKFSDIRKGGRDLGVLNFKLMTVPLKIKIFLSTYEKKDLDNLIKRIKDIEMEIGKFS